MRALPAAGLRAVLLHAFDPRRSIIMMIMNSAKLAAVIEVA
jgi:hypothetical protein